MKTHATQPLTVSNRTWLLGSLALLAVAAAPARAEINVTGRSPDACPAGRFVLTGPALPLGTGLKGASLLEIGRGGRTLRLGTCPPVAAQVQADKKGYTVRASLKGCGAARRVRLHLDAFCGALEGVLRSRGGLRDFTGRSADEDGGRGESGSADSSGESDTDVTGLGVPPGGPPQITGFSPESALPGAVITVFGENFDHRRDGSPWTGTPPYRFYFMDARIGLEQADFVYVSPTELEVVVPERAGTGLLSLAEPVQGGVGSNYGWSPTEFEVIDPTPDPTALRIVNNSQYYLVDCRLNGQQAISGPELAVPPGSALVVPFTSPGAVTVDAGVGFFAGALPDVWFTYSLSATISENETTVRSLGAVTVQQVLSNFGAFADWQGEYYDDNGVPHLARFRFNASGSWTFFDDGVQAGSGFATLVSWPNFSSTVEFRVNGAIAPAAMSHPFGSFLLDNGPPSWRTIQYVRQ